MMIINPRVASDVAKAIIQNENIPPRKFACIKLNKIK
jgi:hypothetical protein